MEIVTHEIKKGLDEYDIVTKMFLCFLDWLQWIIRKKNVILKIKGTWLKNAVTGNRIAECTNVATDKYICSLIP